MKNLIEKYIDLPSSPNSSGWYSLKCQVCNDYKVRGGFNFNDDKITYHCFNCNTKATYFNQISDDMLNVLTSFNIPLEEIQKLNFNNFGKQKQITKKIITDENPLIETPLPDFFHKLEDDSWSELAKDYLINERGINNTKDFYISKGNASKIEKKWYGRLIIPFYREGKLVFYQGRTLKNDKIRYLNATVDNKTTILYNYDEINKHNNEPLFIVEGFFDAYHLNGISINGNELTEKKIKIINQSKRQKIYIPDRYGNGKQAALNAIKAGWNISIPDIGNCKDINEAILRFGYMYVYKSIIDNIMSGFKANVAINAQVK